MKIEKIFKVRYLKWLVIIFALTIIVPLGLYFYNFRGSFSSNSLDWGNLGDYLSGTIGSILILFNLLVTIVIAQIAWSVNENLKEKDIENQFSLFINEQRMIVYFDFIKQKESFIKDLNIYKAVSGSDMESRRDIYEDFERFIKSFYSDFGKLFKINIEVKDKLLSVIHSYSSGRRPDENFFEEIGSFILILQSNITFNHGK
jgi:hypothetical protein